MSSNEPKQKPKEHVTKDGFKETLENLKKPESYLERSISLTYLDTSVTIRCVT